MYRFSVSTMFLKYYVSKIVTTADTFVANHFVKDRVTYLPSSIV